MQISVETAGNELSHKNLHCLQQPCIALGSERVNNNLFIFIKKKLFESFGFKSFWSFGKIYLSDTDKQIFYFNVANEEKKRYLNRTQLKEIYNWLYYHFPILSEMLCLDPRKPQCLITNWLYLMKAYSFTRFPKLALFFP